MTGRSDGATGQEFARYLMETLRDPTLERRWLAYQGK
jgi:isocitrate dehydrogenase (NAD+)